MHAKKKNAFTEEKRKASYVKVAALWKVSVIGHLEIISVLPRCPINADGELFTNPKHKMDLVLLTPDP